MARTIETVDLRVAYAGQANQSDVLALDRLSLRIAAHEFVCIVGRSGCGKTTLLNCIGGSIPATSGRLLIDGQPVEGPGPDRAMVFQQPSLFPWQTTVRNVAYGLEMHGRPRATAEAKAQELLDLVGLSSFAHHYPGQLSGGMQQRANLARALAVDPDVLLLDEPFAALDAQTREYMQVELTRVWARLRKTAVFVTHDIGEAVFLADRVIVLSPGPGTIKAQIAIDLPRPRTLDLKRTAEFLAFEERVWNEIAESADELTAGIGISPNVTPASPPARPSGRWRAARTSVRHEAPYSPLRRLALGTGSVVAVLALWQVWAESGLVSRAFLSSPVEIFATAMRLFRLPAFWRDLATSGGEFAAGFTIASVLGVTIGILTGWYRAAAALLNPFVSGLYSTPRIALAPLLIIWFGIDATSKIALVTLSALFPILINTATGIRTTDRQLVRVARSFGASDWALFRTVAVPASVPFIVGGLRLGAGLGVIGVVVAELIAGTSGIGHRMMIAGQTFQTAEMFVCLLVFTATGIALSALFNRLEAYFDSWRGTG